MHLLNMYYCPNIGSIPNAIYYILKATLNINYGSTAKETT